MEISQLEKLRSKLSGNPKMVSISEYLVERKGTYSDISIRGLLNGLRNSGRSISLPVAREYLEALADCGLGKAVKGEGGDIVNVVNLKLNTREIGAAMVGDSKNLRKYQADRKERDIEGTADAIRSSPSEFKIYPMRKASNVSITVTINGYPVVMPLPDDLKPDQLAALIERLKRVEDGYDPRKK